MAVSYDNLFADLGKFVKSINQFRRVADGTGSPVPDLPDLLNDIETQLDSTDRHDVLSEVPEMYEGFQDAAIGWAQRVSDKVVERLTHRTTILEQLPNLLDGATLQQVLSELYRDMVDQTENVNRTVVTVGSVTADANNNGNGSVLLDKVLDGWSEPFPGAQANPEYKDEDSELSVAEDMSLTCNGDEDSDGLPQGEETFVWRGKPSSIERLDWRTEGSGLTTEVPVLNSHTIVSNKDFEAWDTNVPESWDLDDGVAGTHVIQETTAADVHRGDNCLRFVGDGSQVNIQLSQTLPLRVLDPLRRYCLAAWIKTSGVGLVSGTLHIRFESPSGEYTPSTTERLEINAPTLATYTSYTLQHFYFTIPATIPEDLELVVKMTGTLTSSEKVWVDGLAFGPVVYGNGINCAIVAGATQFTRNDRFSFSITSVEGVFQEYFRRRFRFQLPSSVGPTQADSLAQ